MGYESGVYLSRFIHLLQGSHRSFQLASFVFTTIAGTTRPLNLSGLTLDGLYERLLEMGDHGP